MSGEAGAKRLRVLSFNVNGLRALLSQRLKLTLGQFLDSLRADVVCLQETKLRRCDCAPAVALAEGWDAFFSCSQSPTGYSGTATFVKTAVALPFTAEEGFTGCAALAAATGKFGGTAAPSAVAEPHPALVEHFGVEELTELDSEGRVTVTDHGAFVLFNIYGPAITSEERAEERSQFKLRFYQALELRWRHLLQQGRAVVVVGDLNICPAPLDTASPDPQFFRPGRPDRLWLRRLLHGSGAGGDLSPGRAAAAGDGGGGYYMMAASHGCGKEIEGGRNGANGSSRGAGGAFADTFRAFHPMRERAFTCWSTATNARVLNHGSRIDLILTAGLSVGCPPLPSGSTGAVALQPGGGRSDAGAAGVQPAAAVWVAAADIWPEQQGSDHCPVWADFECVGGAAFPCAATAPPSAMRFAFAGKQLKLHAWLQRGATVSQSQADDSASSPRGDGVNASPPAEAATEPARLEDAHLAPLLQQQQEQRQQQQATAPPTRQPGNSSRQGQPAAAKTGSSKAPAASAEGAGAKKQANLKNLFQRKQQPEAPRQEQQQASQQHNAPSGSQQLPAAQLQQQQQIQQPPGGIQADGSSGLLAAELAAAVASRQQSAEAAKGAWRSIQQRFQVPKCGHGEPAVLKRVNKSGPTKGRYFYTCGRPEGPRPEGKCNYFKWVEKRPGDHDLTTLEANKSGSTGGGGGSGAKRLKSR